MKKSLLCILLSAILAVVAGCQTAKTGEDCAMLSYLNRAVICTDQAGPRILIMDASKAWDDPSAVLWKWEVKLAPEIPQKHRSWFYAVSDCKVLNGGRDLLVVASGGAVAIVNIAKCRAVFYARAGQNPHSAARLPDGNLAAVCSTGNEITLFQVPEKFTGAEKIQTRRCRLEDAHGCVWDKKQKLLWVLGGRELAAYRYETVNGTPALVKVISKHPDKSLFPEKAQAKFRGDNFLFHGHDLFPIPGSRTLFVTTNSAVLCFDTEKQIFRRCRDIPFVKAVSRNPVSGEDLYIVPTESWWSDTVHMTNPERTFVKPGARFYKIRWYASAP